MKHFFLYLITFLSIQWLISSCHALVEDEFPDFAKVPVINGILQADSTFNIHVSFSANLSESAPTPVENAQVIVLGDNSSPDTLRYTQKGWYQFSPTSWGVLKMVGKFHQWNFASKTNPTRLCFGISVLKPKG